MMNATQPTPTPPPVPPARGGMGRFLLKVGLFLAVQAATVAGLIVAGLDDDPYMGAHAVKRNLAETAPGPRVLLVGGSNLAYGVDSARLGEALGRRPVNLGLHAGLGHRFILDSAAASVQPGDLVILSLEYGPGDQGEIMNDLLFLEPSAGRHVRPGGWKKAGDTTLEYLMLKARSSARAIVLGADPKHKSSIYRVSGFDANGDFIAHRDRPPPPGRVLVEIAGATPATKLENVAAFARQVRAAGATLAVVHPPVPRHRYEGHRAELDAWDRALRGRLSAPVLVTPGDAALPDEFFYDTPYHLTGPGIQRRTDRLIALLTADGAPGRIPTGAGEPTAE